MRDVDGGRRIYEMSFFFTVLFFLFRAIGGDWEIGIFAGEVFLEKSGNFTLYVPTHADECWSGVEANIGMAVCNT